MKNQNYVDNLPIGDVVRFGQVLYAMKKRGLIEDYDSTFKYLTGRGDLFGSFEFLGNFFTLKYFSGCFMPFVVKTVPPMKWKNGKRVPAKRIYYKCFRGNFSRKTIGDNLGAACWNNHYKAEKKGFNSKMFDYVCKKTGMFRTKVRKFDGIKDHRICLWGSII